MEGETFHQETHYDLMKAQRMASIFSQVLFNWVMYIAFLFFKFNLFLLYFSISIVFLSNSIAHLLDPSIV